MRKNSVKNSRINGEVQRVLAEVIRGEIKDPRSEKCSRCRWLPLCMGDCPKNRTAAGSALCEDWRLFYSHTIERFEQLASGLRRAAGAPGHNDPCPCGSGRKYKHCCGK